VFAATDVDKRWRAFGKALAQPLIGDLKEVNAGLRHVVAVQELAPRRTRTPYRYAGMIPHLGLVRLAQQRGEYMASLEVVVIARAVEVGGHCAQVARAVLA